MPPHQVRYPVDIIFCLFLAALLIPTELLALPGPQRTLLALPFLIFIPGYVAIFAIFPMRKKKRTIDAIERIALSFAISIALVPLIAFALNFTPYGIRLEPLVLSITLITLITALIGFIRWHRLPTEDRFTPTRRAHTTTSFSTTKLNALVIASLIIVIAVFLYTAANPRPSEAYTAFYLTGSTGKIADYPLLDHANTTIPFNLTVQNNEHQPMNYTITVWLSDEATVQNQTHQNTTVYYHFWYLGTVNTSSPIPAGTAWHPQYSTSINKLGVFHLHFLLFTTTSPEPHFLWQDYAGIAGQIITQAYERLSLAITVQQPG